MKRLLISAACLVLLAGSFSSCKKSLEDDYQNPETITTGSISKLFSGMFLNKRIHASYYDYRTMLIPIQSSFSGIYPISTESASVYVANTGYTDNRWIDFYAGSTGTDYNYNGPGILSNYREMETTLATQDSATAAANEVIMAMAKVIVWDHATQLVDLFGDIPFFKANSLNIDRVVVAAPFDDAATIYDSAITDLARINTYLASATVTTATKNELSTSDLFFGGDVENWRRYANSLRLRLLMRISNVSEASAQTAVTTMLGDAATYPLIDANTSNVLLQESPTTLVSDLQNAFSEVTNIAPEYLLETVMLANSDPRLDVIFDASDSTGWKGFPVNGTPGAYTTPRAYAGYDSTLFYYNYNMPGILFTAAEVSFLKAEAAERWGVGNAQSSYETGISQSVTFWAGLHASAYLKPGTPDRVTDRPYTAPTATDIANYLTQTAIAYSGTTTEKLNKIYLQKWITFSIPQSGQAWAEYRRTGYPEISFPTTTSQLAATPPYRLLYPNAEKLYNEYYSSVEAKDGRYVKLFFAK